MEVYILDPLNRRQILVDQFISFIWTERWQAYGDFELDVYSTVQNRGLFTVDTWLSMSSDLLGSSNYVMRVELVDDSVDDTGNKILKITGRSIEAIMDDRAARGTWTFPPGEVARTVFSEVCVSGSFDVGDIIPGINLVPFMPASTIPEQSDVVTITTSNITTLFDVVVTQICTVWDLGFRILRLDSTGVLYFDIYAGSDRTTDQDVLPPVIFSPQLDNLQDTTEITDITDAKNVAYVLASTGIVSTVYPDGIDPTIAGFERRVLIVDATDIDSPTAPLLTQRGMQMLSASRTSYVFDGTVSKNSQYRYGIDYNLGDLVELQNQDGVTSKMRVTEQIFSHDNTGEFTYPTLVNYDLLNVGTWLSWNNPTTWFDLDADPTTWSEEP
jgi:hypothetical protein